MKIIGNFFRNKTTIKVNFFTEQSCKSFITRKSGFYIVQQIEKKIT